VNGVSGICDRRLNISMRECRTEFRAVLQGLCSHMRDVGCYATRAKSSGEGVKRSRRTGPVCFSETYRARILQRFSAASPGHSLRRRASPTSPAGSRPTR